MSWALLAAGVALLVFAFYDLIKTTLGQGGGPMTNRVTALVWRLGLVLLRRRRAHRLLTVAGVASVLLVLATWLALVWGGWTLIFSSSERAVVWSDSRRPATLPERSRFTGYALVTLGMGDFEPEGGIWKICTALAALDDALTLLGDACRPEHAPSATLLRSTRRTIWSLLATLHNPYIEPAPEPPPQPEVASLAAAGLPLAEAGEVRRRLQHRSHRRRLLLAFVESDGWSWRDVVEAEEESPGGRQLGPGGAGGEEPGGE